MNKAKDKITYDLIKRAVSRDFYAIAEILDIYDGYISSFCILTLTDQYGRQYKIMDEEMKSTIKEIVVK